MQFPNAYKGVKKLWLAAVLNVIATLLMVAVAVLLFTNGLNPNGLAAGVPIAEGVVATAGALTLIMGLVIIVGAVLNLIGLVQGRKDEDHFKTALILVGLGLVLSVISSAITGSSPRAAKYIDTVSGLCTAFVNYFVMMAVASLAAKKADAAVQSAAEKAGKLVLAAIVCGEVLEAITYSMTNSTFTLILSLVGAAVHLVAYVYYLKVLGQAKAMLAN